MASGGLAMRVWRERVGADGDPWTFATERQLAQPADGETIIVADTGADAEAVMIAKGLPGVAEDPEDVPAAMPPMAEPENTVRSSWNLLIFATLPSARRRGHGRLLLDAFLILGRERGYSVASRVVFDPDATAGRRRLDPIRS